MESDFWHQIWEDGDIGFHEGKPNALLVRHLPQFSLTPGDRIFLPLCGKTRDIAWLLDQGYRVVGAELSDIAIRQLFEELGTLPDIEQQGSLRHYSANNIDMFVGDIFDVSAQMLGQVDAIYDRGALVALPPEVRVRYGAHLQEITGSAPQLLLTFEYDQQLLDGPPFSIPEKELNAHYGQGYQRTVLTREPFEYPLHGKVDAASVAWQLTPLVN